jgi:hypothetical protein
MGGLSKYLDAMQEVEADASSVLQEVAHRLEKYDEQGKLGTNYQRIQEWNSVLFWLTQALTEGLPEAIDKLNEETKEVLGC